MQKTANEKNKAVGNIENKTETEVESINNLVNYNNVYNFTYSSSDDSSMATINNEEYYNITPSKNKGYKTWKFKLETVTYHFYRIQEVSVQQ